MKVKINQIFSGEEINSRAGKSDIDSLANSIREVGLVLPIAVRARNRGEFEIIDGHRRFAALKKLKVKEVDVHVVEGDDLAARERSLAANIERAPLHPIDQFEAFAKIAAQNVDAETIARRFGLRTKQVQQALALGGLHDDVRAAWRAGKIDEDIARAFTIQPDKDKQAEVLSGVLAAVKKRQYVSAWNVKSELRAESRSDRGKLKFVGVEAYTQAGGSIFEDLFSDETYASDPALLDRLAQEKLQTVVSRIEGLGFAFVKVGRMDWGAFRYADYEWPEPDTEDPVEIFAGIPQADRGKFGIFVSLDHAGSLDITGPVVKVGDAGDNSDNEDQEEAVAHSAASREAEAHEQDDGISRAVQQSLKAWRTEGYRLAFSRDVNAMICFASGYISHPNIMVRDRAGYPDPDTLAADDLAGNTKRLALQLSAWVTMDQAGDGDLQAAATILGEPNIRKALRECFRAGEFFSRVPARICQEALDAMGVAVPRGLKKKALAELATQHANETGWLPAIMREGIDDSEEERAAA
ncbi:MAG: ParB/RepB/Spo0J family partition protein [Beijerinckiaceae bacterium]